MSQDYSYQDIRGWSQEHGLPMDEWGHLLSKEDVTKDGKQARELTSPYGTLMYVIGSKDDFVCFDFHVLEDGYVVLHAVINSETGSFIQDSGYEIVPLVEAPKSVMHLMDGAFDDVQHSKRGWSQDHWFFYRDVCLTVAEEKGLKVPQFKEKERRFGGKAIEAFVSTIVDTLRLMR